MDMKDVVKTLSKAGSVVAIKTDTVYGLICNAYDKDAISKIYKLKSRDKKKPLALFIKDVAELEKYVSPDSLTESNMQIAKKYWPGALTIIFKKKDDTFSHLIGDATGIGIRIPNDEDLLNILRGCSFPLAETSCNVAGEEPYIDYQSIIDKFGDNIDLVVDGGLATKNIPSTVLSLESGKPVVLRVGEIVIDV